jgi:hypothetical protein
VALAEKNIHDTPPQNRATLLRWQLMPFRYLAAVLIAQARSEAKAVLDRAEEYDRGVDPALMALRARYHASQATAAEDALALKLVSAIEVRPQKEATDRVLAAAKRVKAIIALRRQNWEDAHAAAREAADAGDVPTFAHLLSAIALAHLGDREAGQAALREADAHWPDRLRQGDVLATEDSASLALWIDTRADLEALRAQAVAALGEPTTQP